MNKFYMIFSDKAPNGIICRQVDLKHWVDASAMAVEVDESMIDMLDMELDSQSILRHQTQLPIGKMNRMLSHKL